MPRYFLIPVFLLALIFAAPVSAENKSSGDNSVVHGGGLTCFSVQSEIDSASKEWWKGHSCDALCSDKGAVCTGVDVIEQIAGQFGMRCADPPVPHSTECRCCNVSR